MEYLPGLSLEELVAQYGPLSPGRVVYLLRQVCQALREAHGVGLIHRDLKPSNIIAASGRDGRRGQATGFRAGSAHRAPPSAGGPKSPRAFALTADGRVVGTPLFMSPEQITQARELDERSDIYSLGAVAYHLLTGQSPFERASGMAVMVAHVYESVVPPSQIAAGIPEDLEWVVMRCLAKDATDRFADAESLGRALGACACSGDWNQDRAARWWLESGRSSAPLPAGVRTVPVGQQSSRIEPPDGKGATGLVSERASSTSRKVEDRAAEVFDFTTFDQLT